MYKSKVARSASQIMDRLYHGGVRPETAAYVRECLRRGLKPMIVNSVAKYLPQ